MEAGALGADLAVHRPRLREVGLERPVVARVDVVVLGRDHDVVRRPVLVARVPAVQQLADVGGHARTPDDRERPALAEVVLDVDHDQRACHLPRLAPSKTVGITGSPADIIVTARGSSASEARWRARASSSVARPTTSPARTRGTSSDRSSPSSAGASPMPTTSAWAVPGGGAAAQGVLAAADRHLVLRPLRHRHQLAVGALARDQLVDEAARRVPRAGHQLGADAVRVDRARRPARRWRARRGRWSPRSGCCVAPRRVELRPHLARDQRRGRRSRAGRRRARCRRPRPRSRTASATS